MNQTRIRGLDTAFHRFVTGLPRSFEKVRTPAGEFDAWKVQAKGWINGVSWQGSFPLTQTVWYAPTLNRIVRLELKEGRRGGADNLTELKSFRLAP